MIRLYETNLHHLTRNLPHTRSNIDDCCVGRDEATTRMLDEYDMVGIQIVGDKMRRRLAEKHRMLELQQSRSSFRYALAPLPCTDLEHVITLAKLPVPWIRSAVSGTPSLPCLVLN